jgi:hypothetical protein
MGKMPIEVGGAIYENGIRPCPAIACGINDIGIWRAIKGVLFILLGSIRRNQWPAPAAMELSVQTDFANS